MTCSMYTEGSAVMYMYMYMYNSRQAHKYSIPILIGGK